MGLYRKDVKPPNGGEPGTDPDWLRTQLMEQYNVKYALLNGGGILGLCALPDADFATVLAAAYNDVMAEGWLGEKNPDGRFKGSMMVAPQDPEAAAKEIDRVGRLRAEGKDGYKHFAQVMCASATTAPTATSAWKSAPGSPTTPKPPPKPPSASGTPSSAPTS